MTARLLLTAAAAALLSAAPGYTQSYHYHYRAHGHGHGHGAGCGGGGFAPQFGGGFAVGSAVPAFGVSGFAAPAFATGFAAPAFTTGFAAPAFATGFAAPTFTVANANTAQAEAAGLMNVLALLQQGCRFVNPGSQPGGTLNADAVATKVVAKLKPTLAKIQGDIKQAKAAEVAALEALLSVAGGDAVKKLTDEEKAKLQSLIKKLKAAASSTASDDDVDVFNPNEDSGESAAAAAATARQCQALDRKLDTLAQLRGRVTGRPAGGTARLDAGLDALATLKGRVTGTPPAAPAGTAVARAGR